MVKRNIRLLPILIISRAQIGLRHYTDTTGLNYLIILTPSDRQWNK